MWLAGLLIGDRLIGWSRWQSIVVYGVSIANVLGLTAAGVATYRLSGRLPQNVNGRERCVFQVAKPQPRGIGKA